MYTLENLLNVDHVLRYRFVLVITSPGSSVADMLANLLGEWSSQGTIHAVRLILEEAHNSPYRFLHDLQSILQPPVSAPVASPSGSLEDGLVILLNTVLGYTQDSILVLENYHVIHAAEIHSAVSLLLDYMPPRMHLVITSREQPPLPIPRLRVRSQMVELRI
jgi:LuxR family maltose regulon positive regulatory protein